MSFAIRSEISSTTTSTLDEGSWSEPNATNAGQILHFGWKISTNKACKLVSVTKQTLCTATKCYLYLFSDTSLLSTQTFSGDVATFNYDLANATSYIITCGKDGVGHNRRYIGGAAPPYNSVNINALEGGRVTAGIYLSDPTNSNNLIQNGIKTSTATTSLPKKVFLGSGGMKNV